MYRVSPFDVPAGAYAQRINVLLFVLTLSTNAGVVHITLRAIRALAMSLKFILVLRMRTVLYVEKSQWSAWGLFAKRVQTLLKSLIAGDDRTFT